MCCSLFMMIYVTGVKLGIVYNYYLYMGHFMSNQIRLLHISDFVQTLSISRMGYKTKVCKIFLLKSYVFIVFPPLVLFYFYSIKNTFSGKPYLGNNILTSIVPCLTKLCRMEDKHMGGGNDFIRPSILLLLWKFAACKYRFLVVCLHVCLSSYNV